MDGLRDFKQPFDEPKVVYITGAGVSAASGIPTFRGNDGYWTIGSENYQPEEMATRGMYQNKCVEQLKWYYHRFVSYGECKPNSIHDFLADKKLITQNVDCLDEYAGNPDYIAIHGKISKVVRYGDDEDTGELQEAPWDEVDPDNFEESLIKAFKLSSKGAPVWNQSLKPHILMFDECYTDVYRIDEAREWVHDADKVVFIGTSFSVNFPIMALDIARTYGKVIHVVDPNPDQWIVNDDSIACFKMTGEDYLKL